MFSLETLRRYIWRTIGLNLRLSMRNEIHKIWQIFTSLSMEPEPEYKNEEEQCPKSTWHPLEQNEEQQDLLVTVADITQIIFFCTEYNIDIVQFIKKNLGTLNALFFDLDAYEKLMNSEDINLVRTALNYLSLYSYAFPWLSEKDPWNFCVETMIHCKLWLDDSNQETNLWFSAMTSILLLHRFELTEEQVMFIFEQYDVFLDSNNDKQFKNLLCYTMLVDKIVETKPRLLSFESLMNQMHYCFENNFLDIGELLGTQATKIYTEDDRQSMQIHLEKLSSTIEYVISTKEDNLEGVLIITEFCLSKCKSEEILPYLSGIIAAHMEQFQRYTWEMKKQITFFVLHIVTEYVSVTIIRDSVLHKWALDMVDDIMDISLEFDKHLALKSLLFLTNLSVNMKIQDLYDIESHFNLVDEEVDSEKHPEKDEIMEIITNLMQWDDESQ